MNPSAPALLSYPLYPLRGGSLSGCPDGWIVEPKFNGWRLVVHGPTGTCWNRQGERSSIEKEFEPALGKLAQLAASTGFDWFDCEALSRRHSIGKGTLIVLDIMTAGLDYTKRQSVLIEWLESPRIHTTVRNPLPVGTDGVYRTVGFPNIRVKALWKHLRAENLRLGLPDPNGFYEGLVRKRADSLYPLQKTSSSKGFPFWVKHRFY